MSNKFAQKENKLYLCKFKMREIRQGTPNNQSHCQRDL